MGADDNDGESPWESATNDQAFRDTVSVASGIKGRQRQATGEISDNERSVSSSPAVVVTSVVRWELEEDNSNDINGNNNQNANDVSFLTSETITNTNAAAAATTTNANSSRRRRGNEGGEGGGTEERSAFDCFSKLSLKHILHLWDIILTLFWMVFIGYHLYYNKDNEPSRSTSMAILLVICCILAVLNLLRGLLWLWTTLPSLSTLCCCGCFFDNDDNDTSNNNPSINITVYKLSTNLTLSIGIAYGITAGIGWFGPLSSNWLPWCDGLSGVWCTVLPTKFMPIVLTVSSVIELLRWIFLLGRLSSLETTTSANQHRSPDYYNDEHANDYNAASPSETSRHRPWWWNRRGGGGSVSSNNNNNELHESLLDSSTRNGDDDVVGGGGRQPTWTTMSSWIPFSPSSRQRQRNNNNINNATGTGGGADTTGENNRSTSSPILNGDEDDVESVLDSLGEDWASRTEDDPNWWTR